jgi:tRNA nucleotidyltransferase (CCA-adding enzyme)
MDFEGFRVDLVPCFDIKDPSKLKSAVDRTPHHQRYVREYLTPELADQVLLLKQFVRGIGVYGAEARVQGFSGYLCELMVLSRGSFEKLLEEVAGWKPGMVIDLERAYPNEAEPKILFERQPLIVVDPVDPKRNVAAALSLRSFSMFVLACREFLRRPKLEFFFPRHLRPLTPKGFKRLLKSRGTKLCCLHVKHPDLPEDVIYPQLRKTERAISNELVQAGFEVLRSDVWANEHSAIVLVELSIFRLPQVQARPGPRLTLDVSDFLLEHLESPRRLAGPFVDDAGRVVYELRRQETDATRFLNRVVANCRGFGKNVAESIERGDYALLIGEEITRLFRNRGFRKFITQYLDPRLPWYR